MKQFTVKTSFLKYSCFTIMLFCFPSWHEKTGQNKKNTVRIRIPTILMPEVLAFQYWNDKSFPFELFFGPLHFFCSLFDRLPNDQVSTIYRSISLLPAPQKLTAGPFLTQIIHLPRLLKESYSKNTIENRHL